jgi:hypothetical protein
MKRCPYCKTILGQLRQSVISDVRDRGGTAEMGCDNDKCNMNIIVIQSIGGVSLFKDIRYNDSEEV